VVELADARDSKSRVRKDVRVQVPPPAPRQSEGLATIGCQPFFIALVLKRDLNGLGAPTNREEKHDARECDSPEPRREPMDGRVLQRPWMAGSSQRP
jgi:hypothetical protein